MGRLFPLFLLSIHAHMSKIHEIALGLEYLRSETLVHGDLRGVRNYILRGRSRADLTTMSSQANILIDDNCRARLADFGVLWLPDSTPMTQGSHMPGAVRWMAPEVLSDKVPTFESDIYSFACVCVEVRSPRDFCGRLTYLSEI